MSWAQLCCGTVADGGDLTVEVATGYKAESCKLRFPIGVLVAYLNSLKRITHPYINECTETVKSQASIRFWE